MSASPPDLGFVRREDPGCDPPCHDGACCWRPARPSDFDFFPDLEPERREPAYRLRESGRHADWRERVGMTDG